MKCRICNTELTNINWLISCQKQSNIICNACRKKQGNKYYKENSERIKKESLKFGKLRVSKYHKIIDSYKTKHGCSKCGYNENACALDFHHINPENKFKNVSDLVRKPYSLKIIFKEIKKCKLLCANCHRVEHAK